MKVTKTLYVGDDDKMTIENKGLLYYLLFTRVGEEINNQVLTGEEFDPVFLMNVLQLSRDFLQEEIKKYQEKNPRQDQQTQDSLNMISLVINKTFSPNETNVDSMYNFVSKLLLSVDARQI